MKVWKYKHYDEATKTILGGNPWKQEYYYQDDQPEIDNNGTMIPDVDYDDVTTPERLIMFEATKYADKEADCREFARLMNARLVIMDAPDIIKSTIDSSFSGVHDAFFQGHIFTAKRRLDDVVQVDLTGQLPQEVIDVAGALHPAQYLIDEISDKINELIAKYH